MNFAICLYPNAAWNAETGTHDLGEPSETVATVGADYPAEALVAADATVVATRTETTQRKQRGKVVTMTTFRTVAAPALAAWMTVRGMMALVRI